MEGYERHAVPRRFCTFHGCVIPSFFYGYIIRSLLIRLLVVTAGIREFLGEGRPNGADTDRANDQ